MPSSQRATSAAANSIARRARLAAAVQIKPGAQSSPSKPDVLEVTDLNAFRLREPLSGSRYTLLKVQTRSGLFGFGETAAIPKRDLAEARKIVLGKPASAYEAIRRELPGFPEIHAAVNMALLDILGKVTRAPLYQVLGGPTRNKVRAITALAGDSNEALLDSMRRAREAGFRAFLVPLPPPRASNQGQGYARLVLGRFEQLREAGGDEVDFALDGRAALSPGDASSVAAALERFHLLWFDDPCRVSNLSALRKTTSETVTPLGLGRDLHDGGGFQDLLREEIVDVLRPSLSGNGLTQIRKVAALAETYYVAVAPFHDGGPVGTASALHLAASLPNFFIQQIPRPEAEADRRMRIELMSGWPEKVLDGFAPLPTGPGLGVTVNEAALAKYSDPDE